MADSLTDSGESFVEDIMNTLVIEPQKAKPARDADTITNKLREMIFDGELNVETQLTQETLAAYFQVSRIPVREALIRLEAEGLVRHATHKGYVVATRSMERLLGALDVRIALETHAIALAIPNMTEADYTAMDALLAEYDASDDPAVWSRLNYEFHMALYTPCKRTALLDTIRFTFRSCDVHLRALQSRVVGRAVPQDEHRRLVAACRSRDCFLGRSLLAGHIARTQAVLRGYKEKRADAKGPGLRGSMGT